MPEWYPRVTAGKARRTAPVVCGVCCLLGETKEEDDAVLGNDRCASPRDDVRPRRWWWGAGGCGCLARRIARGRGLPDHATERQPTAGRCQRLRPGQRRLWQ